MKVANTRPPREQIHPTAPQFTSTTTGEYEAEVGVPLNERVNLIEKYRQLLNFIDDNNFVVRRQPLSDKSGVRTQFLKGICSQQIVGRRVGENLLQQRGLPRLSRA
jgi:hypothetical protein